jgi:hypothetical protein
MASHSPQPHFPHGPDDDESSEDGFPFSPWLLVWTILVAKVGTLAIILMAARSTEGGTLIAVTSLPWIAAGVALAAGPVLFRYRLRRVRARRDQLRRQEWMETESTEKDRNASDSVPPSTIRRFT